jgi:hypothetical protein
VIVTPLRIARGIQNKVLEAMAMARPVVISSAPATGLEARSGHDCEIAHSGDEFVSRTVALLADVTLRRTMGLAPGRRSCVPTAGRPTWRRSRSCWVHPPIVLTLRMVRNDCWIS